MDFSRVFCNVGHTSVVAGMFVPDKRTIKVNQGGTADKVLFVLDRVLLLCKDFFIYEVQL